MYEGVVYNAYARPREQLHQAQHAKVEIGAITLSFEPCEIRQTCYSQQHKQNNGIVKFDMVKVLDQ